MGTNQSCESVELKKNNICNISHCATKVNGIPSESASPTDVWFVTLQPNTKYGDTIVNGDVSLKIYLNPNMKFPKFNGKKIVKDDTKELLYETNVYEHVIGPMLEYKINPHFVIFYGSARNCSFKQLLTILDHNTENKTTGEPMDSYSLEQVLIRNSWWIGKGLSDRPSINNPLVVKDKSKSLEIQFYNDNRDKLEYNIIATAKTQGNTLAKWVKNHIEIDSTLKTKTLDSVAEVALIQLVSGLAALELFKCAHNDLHTGNVFIDEFKEAKKVTYIYNGLKGAKSVFKINSNISALIYDWDRAYVNDLGDNNINDYFCKDYSSCNEYVPSRDLLKVFCYILPSVTNKEYKNSILKSIFRMETGINYFKSNVNFDPFLKYVDSDEVLSSEWIIDNLYSPNEILYNLLSIFNKNPYIITNDNVIPENDVYDFTRENFRDILRSITKNKRLSILNFKTKYEKEYDQEYDKKQVIKSNIVEPPLKSKKTVVTPPSKSPLKSKKTVVTPQSKSSLKSKKTVVTPPSKSSKRRSSIKSKKITDSDNLSISNQSIEEDIFNLSL